MRISLSASAANAAPGSKVETAMIAAIVRRKILAIVGLPIPEKLSFISNS
jgi:hypothetical protein